MTLDAFLSIFLCTPSSKIVNKFYFNTLLLKLLHLVELLMSIPHTKIRNVIRWQNGLFGVIILTIVSSKTNIEANNTLILISISFNLILQKSTNEWKPPQTNFCSNDQKCQCNCSKYIGTKIKILNFKNHLDGAFNANHSISL